MDAIEVATKLDTKVVIQESVLHDGWEAMFDHAGVLVGQNCIDITPCFAPTPDEALSKLSLHIMGKTIMGTGFRRRWVDVPQDTPSQLSNSEEP